MQTRLIDTIKNTATGKTADSILRKCVHCGFCTATCPTYQLLGDELDGPRGRIYLIKQLLEGKQVTRKTQTHLDRCLTCRACESTCPSGVEYSHLLDIGREQLAKQIRRPWHESIVRLILLYVLPRQKYFSALVKFGVYFQRLLPEATRKTFLYANKPTPDWPETTHTDKVILLDACAQAELAPNINFATANVLNKLGLQTIRLSQSCCGALPHHLTAPEKAQAMVKANIDMWWPQINSGVKYIVSTASGCGVMIKDYAHLLKDVPDYADKARVISERCKDISEIVSEQDLTSLQMDTSQKLAVHTPCTLQHGQKLNGLIEGILQQLGFDLCAVKDSHLCCGSAGTYSILQKNCLSNY